MHLFPQHNRGEQAEITAHIADFREHYAIGLKFDENLQAYKWADGTTPADWMFSNWGPDDPGQLQLHSSGKLREIGRCYHATFVSTG